MRQIMAVRENLYWRLMKFTLVLVHDGVRKKKVSFSCEQIGVKGRFIGFCSPRGKR
jgi:hypothetical protein